MWSNDFPHPNSTWPNSREVIARDLGSLPRDGLEKILVGNVTKLYKMKKWDWGRNGRCRTCSRAFRNS